MTRSRTASSSTRLRTAKRAKAPDLLLELVMEEFLTAIQQTATSAATPRSYRQVLFHFYTHVQEELGRVPRLSDFTLDAVQRWALGLQKRPKWERGGLAVGDRPVALETRRTYLRTLRTFSNWLPKPPHAFCAEPPLQHLLLPRAGETYKLPLTEDELGKLLKAAKEDSVFGARDTAMLLFLMDSATRASELTGLRVGDVTLQTGLLLVARGKGSRTRAVTVGEETRQALKRYALVRDSRPGAVRTPEAPFFQTVQGTAFSYYGLRSWLTRLGKRAGVPRAHLHLFRHTSAVETLDVGADLRTVQLKLGHASISTTQRYLHMASERLSERQRQFSPVDHLGLGAPKPTKKVKAPAPIPLWRRGKMARQTSPNGDQAHTQEGQR
jgi:site-specific recombinase XerD